MSNRQLLWSTMLAASLILSVTGNARGQGITDHVGQNMAEMKFDLVPGIPVCSTGSVQSGDPSKGPSIILAKAEAGCVIPWHWHTPNEHLMIVSGVARLEAKDGNPLTLKAGGYARMPSRHVHQFHCISSCVFYVYSDAAFDIHYMDEQGMEISPDDALEFFTEPEPMETE